jgi:hypothetical protein
MQRLGSREFGFLVAIKPGCGHPQTVSKLKLFQDLLRSKCTTLQIESGLAQLNQLLSEPDRIV